MSFWRNLSANAASWRFAKGMSGLKTLADKRRQSVGAAREISPDIGRILHRQQDTPTEGVVDRLGCRAAICEGAWALS
jgi:hypothetical protein